MLAEFEQGKSHLGTAARRNHCHAERSGEESEAILAAQSKHPYRNDALTTEQVATKRRT